MGNKKNRGKKKKVSVNGKPFVSVCTPTFNRRIFIPQLIKCFKAQTYPKELMEWIIIDDGDEIYCVKCDFVEKRPVDPKSIKPKQINVINLEDYKKNRDKN